MDRGAWWATVHGVAKSRTWLNDFTFTFTIWDGPWCGALYQDHREQSPEPKSSLELTDPIVTFVKSCSGPYQPACWPHIMQKYPPWHSTLTKHLMPPFQQGFPLSWGCKNLLLNQEKHRLPLELVCCPNSRLCLACQEAGPRCWQCPLYFCSLFSINSLLPPILCVQKFFSSPCLDSRDTQQVLL